MCNHKNMPTVSCYTRHSIHLWNCFAAAAQLGEPDRCWGGESEGRKVGGVWGTQQLLLQEVQPPSFSSSHCTLPLLQ